MSSGINSLSAVCYEDLIKPFSRDRFTDSQATLLNQAMVFTFGALSTGMAFAGGPLGGIIKVGDYTNFMQILMCQ
jgi:sodium-coupled monocarboxylate transporter 8/12